MINYVLLIIISAIGMAALDQDPNSVSLEEWALYAVIIYSAWKLILTMIRLLKETGEL
jgi:ABC-type sugar transport system permease subunit